MPDLVRYLEIVRLCQICQMLSDRPDFVRIARFCQILSDMSDFARFCQILPDMTDFAKHVRFVRCLILSVILNHWFDIARVHVIDLCFELAWRYGIGASLLNQGKISPRISETIPLQTVSIMDHKYCFGDEGRRETHGLRGQGFPFQPL